MTDTVTIKVDDLRVLHTIALRCPYRFIDDVGEPDDLLEITDAVGELLPCAACETARNHPDPYQQSRACDDCEDGDTGGPYA
jgi:hypothetical protein